MTEQEIAKDCNEPLNKASSSLPAIYRPPSPPGEELAEVLYNTVGDFFVPKMCATREQIAIRKLLQLPTLKIDTFHLRKENRPRS